MRTLLIVLFLTGCTYRQQDSVPPPRIVDNYHSIPRETPPTRVVITHDEPPPPPVREPDGPVDCQDQAVLRRYGLNQEVPECLPGTTAEKPPAGEPCYWSLTRTGHGALLPPARACHETCPGRGVAKRVLAQGTVEEYYTGETICSRSR